jgi:hypothetical protein
MVSLYYLIQLRNGQVILSTNTGTNIRHYSHVATSRTHGHICNSVNHVLLHIVNDINRFNRFHNYSLKVNTTEARAYPAEAIKEIAAKSQNQNDNIYFAL